MFIVHPFLYHSQPVHVVPSLVVRDSLFGIIAAMVSLSIMSIVSIVVIMMGGYLGVPIPLCQQLVFKTLFSLSDISLFSSGLHSIIHLVHTSPHISAVSGHLYLYQVPV